MASELAGGSVRVSALKIVSARSKEGSKTERETES